jgi:hypothetical protein
MRNLKHIRSRVVEDASHADYFIKEGKTGFWTIKDGVLDRLYPFNFVLSSKIFT